MKYLSTRSLLPLSLLAILTLAGCDTGPEPQEPAEPPASDSAAEPEQPAGTDPGAAGDEQAAGGEDSDQPQVLEESAAVSDDLQPDDEPIKLARASVGQAERDWQFTEGEHFVRLIPTQPTVGGADKIEVAEVFWYGCPHCRNLEPYLNRWSEDASANVRFVHIPATWKDRKSVV